MKKTLENPLSKPTQRWWVLLSLSAVSWLLVCLWLFKTVSFQENDTRLAQFARQTATIGQSISPEIVQTASADVPRLKLLSEEISELDKPDFAKEADSSTVKVLASRPVVINVDVSGFNAIDQVEQIFLEVEANRQNRARKVVAAEAVGSGSSDPDESNPVGELPGAGELIRSDEPGEQVVSLFSTADSSNLNDADRARQKELDVIEGLSARIGFNLNSAQVNQRLERVLDRMFDPLYLYSEPRVFVSVSTNESRAVATNNLLSRGRGQAIIAYLVSRGLEVDRFSIFIESGDELSFGSHRVRVVLENIIE